MIADGRGALLQRYVAFYCPRSKLGKIIGIFRRACVMGSDSKMLWREAQGQRRLKLLQRRHLPIEPRFSIRTKRVRPTDARPQIFHAEIPQPFDTKIKPVVFEVKPLANSQA